MELVNRRGPQGKNRLGVIFSRRDGEGRWRRRRRRVGRWREKQLMKQELLQGLHIGGAEMGWGWGEHM